MVYRKCDVVIVFADSAVLAPPCRSAPYGQLVSARSIFDQFRLSVDALIARRAFDFMIESKLLTRL